MNEKQLKEVNKIWKKLYEKVLKYNPNITWDKKER